jgi:5,10-methylenetetrahydromethanopterin reductase
MRVWLSTFARAGHTQVVAQQAEASGFYGLMLTDSQCLLADPFVELGAAADATRDLQLGTCATNVVTRHPTVVAGLAATLQHRSAGRMHLGVARGDSAVTKVGLEPLHPEEYGRSLAALRHLVRGETADIDGVEVVLTWLDATSRPPAIVGVASGPRTIETAAGNADGLILQVGSDPKAVERAVQLARGAAPGDHFTIAVYAVVGLERDGADAPPIDGVTPLLARMATASLAGDGTPQADASARAARRYSVAMHGLPDTSDDAPVIEEYAFRGDAATCAERLGELATSGADELVVILGSMTTSTPDLLDLVRAFGDSVLPALDRLRPVDGPPQGD